MITVPKRFQVEPFYQNSSVYLSVSANSFKEICKAVPFYYDITVELKFWENKHGIVPIILEWWSEEEQTLTKLYADRDTIGAKPLMITMIAGFIDCLFWMNDRQVEGLNQFDQSLALIQFKPINCEERLNYILSAPSQYHSFIQLKALFHELKKIYAKIRVLEARNKCKGSK